MVMQGLAQRFGPFTQTADATWAASSTIQTDLERLGLITRVVVTKELTLSADLDAANQPGGLYRSILNERIVAGGKAFVTLPNTGESGNAGQVLHAMNAIDFRGMPGFVEQQTDAAPNRTFYTINFIFHFGSRPQDKYGRDNPFDLTAFIPSKQVSDLVAEWVTGLNSLLDDTVTISSGTGRYTLYYVNGTHQEVQNEMRRQEVNLPANLVSQGCTGMVPSWVANTIQIDGTYSDYTLQRNLAVGRYLKRVFIASQDATGTRALLANDEITGASLQLRSNDLMRAHIAAYAAQMPKGNFFVADDAVELGAGGHTPGILPMDFRTIGHPDYGLDLTRGESGQVGAAKLGQTVTAQTSGDDALYLEEAYEPYFGDLG